MNIVKVKNAQEGGKVAFDMIAGKMAAHQLHVLGLATGSTPITLYQEMTASDLDFSDVVSMNLDEYVGLAPEDKQSYHYFMEEHLFTKKPFKVSYVPNGLGGEKACAEYEALLKENPIDLQILGIGRNGHIGFNEPGTPFNQATHIVHLTQSTIEANKRFFDKVEDVPTKAVSMGIASIMQAKEIILMAYGKDKAEAIKAMVEGPVTEEVPASILQNHPNVTIIVDEEAVESL